MSRGLLAAFLMAASLAFAGAPRYADLLLSDVKDGKAKAVFAKNTEKIFLTAKLADVPGGAKLKSEWIAVKTKVAPPNYKIDAVELTTNALTNQANFALSAPTAGWPAGDYRIDLYIDGKKATSVSFQVQ